jgi:tetratricopeptide (TPR) repeat protein
LRLIIITGLILSGILMNLPAPEYGLPQDLPGGKNIKQRLQVLDSLVNFNRIRYHAEAVRLARSAVELSRGSPDVKDIVKAYTIMGYALYDTRKDSSYYYYSYALNLADSLGDQKMIAHLYYNLAALFSFVYDYNKAIILLDSCAQLSAVIEDFQTLANAFNLLGNIYFEINNEEEARKMYQDSYNIAQAHLLYRQMGVAYGNLAKFHINPDSSINSTKKAIRYLQKSAGTEEEIALFLNNIGSWELNPDSAIFYCNLAISTCKEINAPRVRMGAYNTLSYSYMDKGELKNAENCLIIHAIPIAVQENDYSWQATLFDSYSDVLRLSGQYEKAIDYLKKSGEARKKADDQMASEQLRLLTSILNLKNKELEIHLKDKIILSEQKKTQRITRVVIVLIFIILVISAISVAIIQRNRYKVQLQKTESARRLIQIEENAKGILANELHVMAGRLFISIARQVDTLEIEDMNIKP